MRRRTLLLAVVAMCTLSGVAYVSVRPLVYEGSESKRETRAVNEPAAPPMICTGMVESEYGEVEVCAQIAGELAEVRVKEGDAVEKGEVLAVVDARREAADVAIAEANVALAAAKVKRIRAGAGQEERDEALFSLQAVEALMKYERLNVERLRGLYESKTVSLEQLEHAEQQLENLCKQAESLRKRHAALRRGPIPEEVASAQAEVALAEERLRMAKVIFEYREVRAPFAGKVVAVHRHAGDTVSLQNSTPVVRLIDTNHLRIRLEVEEADAPRVRPAVEGTFQVRGVKQDVGRLRIRTVLPQFGPKRLFNPDTSARVDTRVLGVLCDVLEAEIPLHPGQRITATIQCTFQDAVGDSAAGSAGVGGKD